MKLYRNLVAAVAQVLENIFVEKKYADKEIEKILKSNPKWGARDRTFIAESSYEIVRWWRLLEFLLQEKYENNTFYFWRIIGIWLMYQKHSLPDWDEWKNLPKNLDNRIAQAQKVRPIAQSIPDWLDLLGEKQLGLFWENTLKALNQNAQVIIRVNTLKTQKLSLQKQLAENNIFTNTLAQIPDALVLEKRTNLFQTTFFRNGLFEIQDASSQLVAPFLEVEQGMRVIDACAGAGGKSLHLASLMQNKGKIIALDVEAWKLQELEKRAKRLGVQNIETRNINGSKVIKRLDQSADRLLLDVPCSGLGVLRRNPDTKWKLSESFLESVQKTQREILENYTKMLKIGGKMVYATCSILPSENEEQITWFLDNNKNFRLIQEQKISPLTGSDGFYMARLERLS